MEFSMEEFWSGLPLHTPGDLSDLGIETASIVSPPLAGGFFTMGYQGSQEKPYSINEERKGWLVQIQKWATDKDPGNV